jgi:UDP-glucose 4-epimerase
MSLEQAVDLVLFAFLHGESGAIYVQKSPAAEVMTIARAVIDSQGLGDYPIEIIGTRHGEKLYETLLSREEMVKAKDMGEYFCVPPDMRSLNYDLFIEKGEPKISSSYDYNSHNAKSIDVNSMSIMISNLEEIRY